MSRKRSLHLPVAPGASHGRGAWASSAVAVREPMRNGRVVNSAAFD